MANVRETPTDQIYQIQRDLLGMSPSERFEFLSASPERLEFHGGPLTDYSGAVAMLSYAEDVRAYLFSKESCGRIDRVREVIEGWKGALRTYVKNSAVTDRTLRTLLRYAVCWSAFELDSPEVVFAELRDAGYLYRGDGGGVFATGLGYKHKGRDGKFVQPHLVTGYRIARHKRIQLSDSFVETLPLLPASICTSSACGEHGSAFQVTLTAGEERHFSEWYWSETRAAA